MSETWVGTVQATFEIRGRGCVIQMEALAVSVQPNSQIELRRYDGSVIKSQILEIQKAGSQFAFLLPPDVHKQEVPKGTQVFLVGGNF